MFGENFGIDLLNWLKVPINCPPWLEKNFGIGSSQLAKNALKMSMVGENFGTD